MLNADIIKEIKSKPEGTTRKCWSESAEPKTVREIRNAGIPIIATKKGAGSVVDGIQFMQGLQIFITEHSVNFIKEFDNYTWQQDRDGKWLNVPVDDFNHGIDGARYVCFNELMGKRNKDGGSNITALGH